MTLASILYQVADEVGVTRPSVNAPVAADISTQQFVALLKRAGESLLEAFNWSALITSGTVTTASGTASYPVAADFNRFVDETQWLTSSEVPLFGPMNQPDWAQNEFGMVSVSPYYRQQLRGLNLYLQPTPASVQTINYYYISKNWIIAAGVPSATFALDSDTFLLRDDLLVAGLRWRWLRAKRLSYDEERDDYDRLLMAAKAQDRGARTISMDPAHEMGMWNYGFVVPITGFGS